MTQSQLDLINTYLWFAYLPQKEIPTWLDDCITTENKGETYTPEEAASRFDELFDRLLAENPADKHVIPLSGGWDSRAILGALLERLDTSQIETVTFGVPGQLDYDIGIKVANWAGVKHHALDLLTVGFTWDAIHNSVKKSPWTYTPDGYFNQLGFELVNGSGVKFWSGFLGDAVNGGHTSAIKQNLIQIINSFVNKERRCKSLDLVKNAFDPSKNISRPDKEFKIPPADAVFFGYHCLGCTTPINLPTIEWSGWNGFAENKTTGLSIFTPFVDHSWAGYWLSAPHEQRVNQKLFFELIDLKFAQLFSLPSKSNLGLPSAAKTRYQFKRINHGIRKRIQKKAPWLNIRSSLGQNYLDYDEMFRKRKDYQETLITAFDYLKSNQVAPWLDLDKLWKEHMQRRKDHGEAFQVLLGLAANLKAAECSQTHL